MSQVIVIENDNLKAVLTQKLVQGLGVQVVCLNSAEEAIALLKTLLICPLIITRVKMGKEETLDKLYNFLSKTSRQEYLIAMGEHPKLKFVIPCLPVPISSEDLVNECKRKLATLVQDNEKDFLPVKIIYLEGISETPCDIYIRIKKYENSYQFYKLIKKDEPIDRQKIQNYRDLNLNEIYVTAANNQIFYTALTKNMVMKLSDKSLKNEARILATADAHKIVRNMIKDLELIPISMGISKCSIQCIEDTIQNSSEISSLLVFLLTNDVDFAYQQCHLRALIIHHVLTKQSWYKKQHLDVLTFVSFFSGITLETPEEMLVSSVDEFESTYFPEESRFKILFHPRESVELAMHHPDFNDTIKAVLLQSNGTIEGFGLERDPGEELHPLSKVFIVANEFVKILLNPKLTSGKKEIIEVLSKRFTHPSYKKILKTLELKFN